MLTAKAIIHQGELNYISQCVLDYPSIETGGDLFGFWTYSGFPVIQYVIGPGPRSNHQVAFFNQDVEYLDTTGRALRNMFGLQHIGEWHSHHRLGLAQPSGHDCNTVNRAIDTYELKQFFLVIANIHGNSTGVNGFMFNKGSKYYDDAHWVVLPGESPFRNIINREYPELIYIPRTGIPSLCDLKLTTLEEPIYRKTEYAPEYWLSDRNNHSELKKIVDGLNEVFDNVRLLQNADKTVFIEWELDKNEYRLEFTSSFPSERPNLTGRGQQLFNKDQHDEWNVNKSISETTLDLIAKSFDKAKDND